ncbi:nucleotide-binding protein [Paenibacillus sp. CAA11]|uniref:TIR domain-containing protein n=1 Tax=Paenibacillus sp. CAA11 TaxID=1532905 RepID=UPI000D37E749|nr:nucleotide-binding protein [Paenibacillus sp. CAA11]AWB46041.1 nucleotide-binding protein [Paenibacillus sp. CAA11]
MRKPKLFIGSSREAIKYARGVHEQLKWEAQITPWYANAFHANEYTMEALERNLDESDFAVFIFSPDDVAQIRGKYYYVTRDNTQFELGLFWGKLRRKRVFCLLPDTVEEHANVELGQTLDEYHLMSDLHGLTQLNYEASHDNMTAAVDLACSKLLEIIREQGFFPDPAKELENVKLELRKKQSVLHFFWQYTRINALGNGPQEYNALSEAVRISFQPPEQCHVIGAAFWQVQGSEGLAQVGGNVGRGRFYSFAAAEEEGNRPSVVEAYLTSEWNFYQRMEVAQVYILCYPLGDEHVLSVHFSGNDGLTPQNLKEVVAFNSDLLRTINHLVGGDTA